MQPPPRWLLFAFFGVAIPLFLFFSVRKGELRVHGQTCTPACADPEPGCYYSRPPSSSCSSCGQLVCTTPTPTPYTEPLLCTGVDCIRDSQTGKYQCSMQPVPQGVLGNQSAAYEGYCIHIQNPSVEIPLSPILAGSPTFQPIYLHPGLYSCMFRYCLTSSDGTKRCIAWGQGGPLPPPANPTPVTRSPTPTPFIYACPESNWINCMPTIGGTNPQCNEGYLHWIAMNCLDFLGVAY